MARDKTIPVRELSDRRKNIKEKEKENFFCLTEGGNSNDTQRSVVWDSTAIDCSGGDTNTVQVVELNVI